jgi:hypothetical protein
MGKADRPVRARRPRWWIAVPLAGLAVVPWVLRADAKRDVPPPSAIYALDQRSVPDDALLLEQLADAVELRHRENFDRMLDAKDSGELIEHATLTEVDFDHRTLGIDTLFIVGDELFAYLFRPENGWGRGSDRLDDRMPQLRRVHRETSGGPDAFACFSCHAKGGPDGAGTQSQVAMLRGDGTRTGSADRRNAPHLLGLGPVALLAREMTRDLQRLRDDVVRDGGEVRLVTKGVDFGVLRATDGRLDTSGVQGVDADLVVKPFGWKGHQATLRGMIEESLHIHQGLLSKRVQLAVRDGAVDAKPYGAGAWYDVDQDGVSLEIDDGMLTTVVGYFAQLEAPVVRPPRDPGLVDAFAAGRERFDAIGCAGCHVPILELDDPKLDAQQREGANAAPFIMDVAKDGDGPKVEPKYAGPRTPYLVNLFSDLKRHDMGPMLASPGPQGAIPARVFLTRPLWGLAETAPYLHDGRAPTIHDAIVLHGGEAAGARDAYLALDEAGRGSVRVFLASLSRQPKLFMP